MGHQTLMVVAISVSGEIPNVVTSPDWPSRVGRTVVDRIHWKVIKLVALIHRGVCNVPSLIVNLTNIFSFVITSKPELISFQ